MEENINFSLSVKEAELLMNALQTQTNNVINKMQRQYAEQSQQPETEQILVEDNLEVNDDY